ncbi:hypothetical protein AMJ49_00640 [Parcubacteria bacterium DG_74_2]|nr:MAG: hypothetical protein AMJ49_00640 [Parcubacteria bacterium DG_74_2]
MKKFLLFLISLLIGVILFIWVINYVGWQEIKKAFSVFTGWQGMVILFLTFLLMLTGVWKWKVVLKSNGVDISFSDLFQPYFAGFSIMYLMPIMLLGGETLRAYFLKEKKSVSWSKGMASVIVDRILDWTTNLIIVFFGMSFFLFKIGLPPQKLAIIFGGTFLFWLIGICFFYFKAFKKESMLKIFLRAFNFGKKDNQPLEFEKEIFNFFKIKKISFWRGLGLAFLEELIVFLRAGLLILFLGKAIDPLSVLSIDSFSYLATMIPIPASLGSHEVLQAFAFNALRLGAGFGTTFTLILRGAEIILVFFGIGILLKMGLKIFEDYSKNES